MKWFWPSLFLAIYSLLLVGRGYAQDQIKIEDGVFPELATSARALSMGNAYVSKADDSSAVYYNPAGLGTVRHAHLHLSNLHVEVNKGWMQLGTGGSLSQGSTNFAKSFSLEGVREQLNDGNRGKISHSRFHFLPNFTSRYFSAGFLYSMQTRATINNSTTSDPFEFHKRTDLGPYAAINVSFGGGIFKVGVSGTILSRSEVVGTSSATTAFEETEDVKRSGVAAILVLGAKLTLPVKLLPSFALKVNNAGSQKFSGTSPPDKIKQSIDMGFSITPQIGKMVRIHLEANYKDFSEKYTGLTKARRFGAGVEFDFARTFFIRAGYGDGFGSAGLGIRSKKLEFDLITYAVDSTSSAFRGKEDRRFAISLSSGF